MNDSILSKAFEIANRVHSDQKRSDGITPYISHPLAVASLVFRFGGNTEQVAAALLHDTLSSQPHDSIAKQFNFKIADLVYGFADPVPPENGYRTIKDEKLAYLNKVSESSIEQILLFACEEYDELLDAYHVKKFAQKPFNGEEITKQMNQAWYFRECLKVINDNSNKNNGLKRLSVQFAYILKAYLELVFEGNQSSLRNL